jgi:hypothetical protein
VTSCVAITYLAKERDYVVCEGPATDCILVGLFRCERASLCEAHQKYFIDDCGWCVFEAASMRAVAFQRKERYTMKKGYYGWYEKHDAALEQIKQLEPNNSLQGRD